MNTLLIVEDEKKIRQGIRSIAMRSGVKVERILECADGEKALDVINREPVDVMITDIRMPRMDGIKLVKSMQRFLEPPLTIVLSGYDDFNYAVELMRCGVREYILKPVDREQLFAALQKMELEVKMRQAVRSRATLLDLQQLKYLMLNKDITRDELDAIAGQCTSSLLAQGYFVCCAPQKMAAAENTEGILSMGFMDGMAVYLANNAFAHIFSSDTCTGLGMSLAHRGPYEVLTAYEEAATARHAAFAKCLPAFVYGGKANRGLPIPEDVMERSFHLAGAGKMEDLAGHIERIAADVTGGVTDVNDYALRLTSLVDTLAARWGHLPAASQAALEAAGSVFSHNTIADHIEAFRECAIVLNEQIKREEEQNRTTEKIRLALTYMQENFHKSLNMAMVSNYVSMNYSQFSNAFKEYTDMNFVAYLQEMRLIRAKHLFRTTELKVFEISWKIGYGNEKHFMKTFRAAYGISPTEYRKKG